MPQTADAPRLWAGGKSLEYRWWGPGPKEAVTLVLLHEGLGSLGLWRDVPARLAAATGLGVLAYSRAGYGHSDPADLPRPLDYMTREAVEVLPDVLDTVGLERAILVGHSDGATIAAIHAGTSRDPRLLGLVLIAPHFFTEPGGLAEIARAKEAYETGDLGARLARHHADPGNAFRGWNDAWLDPGFRDWTVAEVIDGIPVPILAIQGEDDPYGTRAQIDIIERRAAVPVDVVMLPGCRHAPQFEAPDATLAAIAAFAVRMSGALPAEPA